MLRADDAQPDEHIGGLYVRKVVASEFVPLDNVLEDPSWSFQFSSEDWSWVAG
jgi:hypothetical protein